MKIINFQDKSTTIRKSISTLHLCELSHMEQIKLINQLFLEQETRKKIICYC